MREIKFRGKRTDNGEWVYGDLHHGPITGNIYIMGTQVIPETVGQYTGLKDKNGLTDIYEGDVIDANGNIRGNIHEASNERGSYTVVEGLGTSAWRDTEQRLLGFGCKYTV